MNFFTGERLEGACWLKDVYVPLEEMPVAGTDNSHMRSCQIFSQPDVLSGSFFDLFDQSQEFLGMIKWISTGKGDSVQ